MMSETKSINGCLLLNLVEVQVQRQALITPKPKQPITKGKQLQKEGRRNQPWIHSSSSSFPLLSTTTTPIPHLFTIFSPLQLTHNTISQRFLSFIPISITESHPPFLYPWIPKITPIFSHFNSSPLLLHVLSLWLVAKTKLNRLASFDSSSPSQLEFLLAVFLLSFILMVFSPLIYLFKTVDSLNWTFRLGASSPNYSAFFAILLNYIPYCCF